MAPAGPLIPVQIVGFFTHNTATPMVALKGAESKLVLIPLGEYEAQALLVAIHQLEPSRPLPYDLLQAVLERLQMALRQLVIHTLREDTLYAYLVIDTSEQSIMQDCRPSDGMVMATRLNAPIYVTPEVVEQAGVESES